jgi:hypothetical protein
LGVCQEYNAEHQEILPRLCTIGLSFYYRELLC